MKTILDLREGECRWPIDQTDDGVHAFCGDETTLGEPYCEVHARLRYPSGELPAPPARTAPRFARRYRGADDDADGLRGIRRVELDEREPDLVAVFAREERTGRII